MLIYYRYIDHYKSLQILIYLKHVITILYIVSKTVLQTAVVVYATILMDPAFVKMERNILIALNVSKSF